MKKIIILAIAIIAVILLILIGMNCIEVENVSEEIISDYTPEEEIKKDDMRNTVITLYFQNKENKELQPEARNIDSKELLKEPYKALITLLLEGPKKEQYEKIIADETKINNVEFSQGVVTVDLSKEFLNSDTQINTENNIVYSIVNTLKQLKEVENVRILVDGKENMKLNNGKINLSDKL